MEQLFFIQDKNFISEDKENIIKVTVSSAWHYRADREYCRFTYNKDSEGKIKLRLGELIEKIGDNEIGRYRHSAAVNLNYADRILPLKEGRSIHDLLMKSGEKLGISRVYYRRFKRKLVIFNDSKLKG